MILDLVVFFKNVYDWVELLVFLPLWITGYFLGCLFGYFRAGFKKGEYDK